MAAAADGKLPIVVVSPSSTESMGERTASMFGKKLETRELLRNPSDANLRYKIQKNALKLAVVPARS
jgi:hypothetical protein